MKRIIIYNSKTGFTEAYATWIHEATNIDMIKFSDISKVDLKDYDEVVYGGSIAANKITGLKKVQKLKPKSLVVFACGFSPNVESVIKAIKDSNGLGETKFFYMQGGIDYEKLGKVMGALLKKLTKQPTSVNYSSKEYANGIINYLNGEK